MTPFDESVATWRSLVIASRLEAREYAWFERGLLRLAAIAISGTILVLASPLLLLIAVIIRLDSPGPAIFRQTRLGRDMQPFTFYKFRTMFVDARERFPELYAYRYTPQEIPDLQFKKQNDPRVTRVGKWLRISSLDELPNFLNVLRGDMELVGPRPEIPEMVPYYRDHEMIKWAVKPGITGLAQIRGRGRIRFVQTNTYDVEYLKTRSFWFDIKILLTTARMIIAGDGAF